MRSNRDILKKSTNTTYHESGQRSWFYPAINVVQDTAVFFLNFDVVANIVPLKDGCLPVDVAASLLR